ncbi:MAG: tRNA (adenosine(37)-N6)-threonylcarbamoyltransferase complex dimerization subunit type 1 TsaB [Clostridia bacterium]|nr:tRNA (adenosine(37)-N6)-threonylcarbamoyltransferase complex dimerization subunit type 1 TsaB [Clostridia bacterium]
MKILALESSAKSAGAVLTDDGKVLCEVYSNLGLTHSQTLLPMCEYIFNTCGVTASDIDLFAVSAGPGSFTGIRIGVAAIKGLALAADKPCAGVSTLEALANNVKNFRGIICAVMDARCAQVYNALFESDGSNVTRLTEDRAISITDLKNELKKIKKNIILVGDGAVLCYNEFRMKRVVLAPEHLMYQHASSVAEIASKSERISPQALEAKYLRLPQAERERLSGGKK